jgi:prepilin-type N-terminal cleavage/methylation domain-containing protein
MTASLHNMPERRARSGARAAFTIIELMVVIAIIGVLAAISLPAIRGMTKSNAMIAANRQLLDDIAYARQRAIADHTTVYMVFIPPHIVNPAYVPPAGSDPVVMKQYTNLLGAQFTTYSFLSLRSVGEQPGRSTPRYLTGWRSLPNGVFIATNKFNIPPPFTQPAPQPFRNFPVLNTFPFPLATNTITGTIFLPYIGFDYLGRLVRFDIFDQPVPPIDEYIPLARGSIFYPRDSAGNFTNAPADVQENPLNNSVNNSNVIHIEWLTGRAKVERQEVQ